MDNLPPAQPRIIVTGSLNVDRIWRLPVFPTAGETIIAQSPREEFGGKGANQAVAAARQGAQVTLVGAVGNDSCGERYREYLEQEGIASSHLRTASKALTGSAHVYLDPSGENMIVVDQGANMQLGAEHIETALRSHSHPGGSLLLAQLECPPAAIQHGLAVAQSLGIHTMLNASPVCASFKWGRVPINSVIVNEHECLHWFGPTPQALWESPDSEREALLKRLKIDNLIITRGSQPTFCFSARTRLSVPCIRVNPLDTVGAGDTFAGALAVQIAEGRDWPEAILHANTAAALATLAIGAQTAMPSRQKVLRHLQSNQPATCTAAL